MTDTLESLALTRRELLNRVGMGFGSVGLAALIVQPGIRVRGLKERQYNGRG